MKNIFFKLTLITITASLVLFTFGCNEKEESSNTETTVPTTSASTEAVTTQPKTEFSLENLHTYTENGDKFAGIWKITDGTGSKLETFLYLFDGKGNANLVTGTSGYIGTYSLDDEYFVCRLMFGINGKYTYTIENDKINLYDTEHKDTTVLSRVDKLGVIPKPFESFETDSNLLGGWQSANGETYYFDESGIMYQNQYDTMYTYYSYSAKDGKLKTQSYIGSEKTDDEVEYSVSKDTLLMNDMQYKKIDTSKVK